MNKPTLKTCSCGNKRLDSNNVAPFFCEVCIYREKNKYRIAEIDKIVEKMKEPVVYVWKKNTAPSNVKEKKHTKSYDSYLNSSAWQAKRVQVMKERGASCEACNKATALHVHHLDYKNLYHEEMDDLLILCETCHDALHVHYDLHLRDKQKHGLRWKSLRDFSQHFVIKAWRRHLKKNKK